MLRSKKYRKKISLWTAAGTLIIVLVWSLTGVVWNRWDYGLLDLFYQQAAKREMGPQSSGQIVYLAITDETYEYLGKNHLDRNLMASANRALADLAPQAAVFDIVFARPSPSSDADLEFENSIRELRRAYLPLAFDMVDSPLPFHWEEGGAFDRLKQSLKNVSREKGFSRPHYGTRALMQKDEFALATYNFGTINAYSDSDGIYRHLPLLVRVDDGWTPTVTLAMFLDYTGVSLEQVEVHWGETLTIPAEGSSRLDKDLKIPIDERGNMFIPFTQTWGKDFPAMTLHTFVELYQDESLRGNLSEFFEDKFVFIADISQGVHDLGQTPFESKVPLVSVHTSSLNGMLTRTFYRSWSLVQIISCFIFMATLIGLSAWLKAPWYRHGTFFGLLAGTVFWTWYQFTQFSLFPIATIMSAATLLYVGLLIVSEVSVSKDRVELRNAFSKFLPPTVMEHLLEDPGRLQLGGEEKELSVLFLDIAGFTSFSEKMAPHDLVDLLNQHFTQMSRIIQEEGGIIDKFQGDAIMAEFGAPIHTPDHADRAVSAALKMLERIKEMQRLWKGKGVHELTCRVGINTGKMIIGNMGSDQVFDYTVIGDSVNLASRLESANKYYGTRLMISEMTHQQLTPDKFQTRLLDFVKVKGKSEAVRVYEVYSLGNAEIKDHDQAYYRHYNSGIEALIAGQLDTALDELNRAKVYRPQDLACRNMLERISDISSTDHSRKWDGTFALTDK